VIDDGIAACHLQHVGLGLGDDNRRECGLEVVERLAETLAQLVQHVLWRHAHVLDGIATPGVGDDAGRREALEHGVDLRRRHARGAAELVAVLRAARQEPEVQPRLVERQAELLEARGDLFVDVGHGFLYYPSSPWSFSCRSRSDFRPT
jgi:hypothetical protein